MNLRTRMLTLSGSTTMRMAWNGRLSINLGAALVRGELQKIAFTECANPAPGAGISVADASCRGSRVAISLENECHMQCQPGEPRTSRGLYLGKMS
jgi:hypothetical protein